MKSWKSIHYFDSRWNISIHLNNYFSFHCASLLHKRIKSLKKLRKIVNQHDSFPNLSPCFKKLKISKNCTEQWINTFFHKKPLHGFTKNSLLRVDNASNEKRMYTKYMGMISSRTSCYTTQVGKISAIKMFTKHIAEAHKTSKVLVETRGKNKKKKIANKRKFQNDSVNPWWTFYKKKGNPDQQHY